MRREARQGAVEVMPERLTDERLVSPHDGGCWYCHKADENLVFSIEWDAYVHLTCVREALERDPQDTEAWVFARELGIAAEIIAELVALRRVAEAAERDVDNAKAMCGYHADVPLCYGPDYERTCTDCPYDIVRDTEAALAELRRVREGEG